VGKGVRLFPPKIKNNEIKLLVSFFFFPKINCWQGKKKISPKIKKNSEIKLLVSLFWPKMK